MPGRKYGEPTWGGGQKGLKGDRTGLYFQMLRAIDESRPRYVVAENVENILRTNNGRDWWTILNELGRLGYNAEWRICRASEVGAAHHRARVYLVAYNSSIRISQTESFFAYVGKEISQRRRHIVGNAASVGISWEAEPEVCFVDDGISKRLDGITFPKWRDQTIMAAGNAICPKVVIPILQAINELEKSILNNLF